MLHPCLCPENGLNKSHHYSLSEDSLLVFSWLQFTCQSQTMSHHHKGPMTLNTEEPSSFHGLVEDVEKVLEGERERCHCGMGWVFLSIAQRRDGTDEYS